MLVGAPIIIEKRFNVDQLAFQSHFGPKEMTAPLLDLDAHFRCQKKTPTHAQPSAGVHSEEKRDIRALSRCPGLVIRGLQF